MLTCSVPVLTELVWSSYDHRAAVTSWRRHRTNHGVVLVIRKFRFCF